MATSSFLSGESPLTLDELTAHQSQFQLVRFVRNGRKTIWEAHVRAVYVSQYFVHQLGTPDRLMRHINAALEGDLLPLGNPDFMTWPIPVEHSNLKGSVVAIRATWPSERELGL